MSRDQLLSAATAMIDWINHTPFDASGLAKVTAQNVAVPIPYPGSTPDYQGLLATTEQIHSASPDFHMAILERIVDEAEGRVVLKLNTTGTHVGEWLGVPGSGKKFNTMGFLALKIDPASNMIIELQMVFQDLLFLQQIGVLPAKPA